MRGRSRPARCAAPIASPSTISCCASRRTSARQPSTAPSCGPPRVAEYDPATSPERERLDTPVARAPGWSEDLAYQGVSRETYHRSRPARSVSGVAGGGCGRQGARERSQDEEAQPPGPRDESV